MAENKETGKVIEEKKLPLIESGSNVESAYFSAMDEIRATPGYQKWIQNGGRIPSQNEVSPEGWEEVKKSIFEKIKEMQITSVVIQKENGDKINAWSTAIEGIMAHALKEQDTEKAKAFFKNNYNQMAEKHNKNRIVLSKEEAQATLTELGGSLGADKLKDLQTKGKDGISPKKKINSLSLQDLARLQVEIQLSKMDGKDDFKGIEGIVNNAVLKKMENVAAGYSMGKDWETFKTNKQSLQALHKFSPELKKNFALTMNMANHRLNPSTQKQKLYKGEDMKKGFINSVIYNNFYRSGSWGKKNVIQPWRKLKRNINKLFQTPDYIRHRQLHNHNREIKARMFMKSIPGRIKNFANAQKEKAANWMKQQKDKGVKWFKNTKLGKALSAANKWRKDTVRKVKEGVTNGVKAIGRGIRTGAEYAYKGVKITAKVATAPVWGPPYLLYRGTKAAYSWGVQKAGDIKRDVRTSMDNSIAKAQEDKMRYANRGKRIDTSEKQDEVTSTVYEEKKEPTSQVVNDDKSTGKTIETQEQEQTSQTPPTQTQETQTQQAQTQQQQQQAEGKKDLIKEYNLDNNKEFQKRLSAYKTKVAQNKGNPDIEFKYAFGLEKFMTLPEEKGGLGLNPRTPEGKEAITGLKAQMYKEHGVASFAPKKEVKSTTQTQGNEFDYARAAAQKQRTSRE